MTTDFQFEKTISNLEDLKNFWQEFLPQLSPKCLLLMSGEVGAGKTTSVQMMAEALGLRDVQSPSFAIHLRYENDAGFGLDHVDLYRIKDDDDLESSGFWDLFSQRQGLIIVEWADRLSPQFLPLDWQKIAVQITLGASGSRVIKVASIF